MRLILLLCILLQKPVTIAVTVAKMLLACSVFSALLKVGTSNTGIYLWFTCETSNWSLTHAYDFQLTQVNVTNKVLDVNKQRWRTYIWPIISHWPLPKIFNQCDELGIGCPQATVEVIATAAMQRLGDFLPAVSCIHLVQRRGGLLTRYYCDNSIRWQSCLKISHICLSSGLTHFFIALTQKEIDESVGISGRKLGVSNVVVLVIELVREKAVFLREEEMDRSGSSDWDWMKLLTYPCFGMDS